LTVHLTVYQKMVTVDGAPNGDEQAQGNSDKTGEG
jgi:hypothetical protein